MTTSTLLLTSLTGLGTGLALIVAIGAQNAYVLKLGLQGVNRVIVPVIVICALSDAVLITAGVAGVGAVVAAAPQALVVVRVVGAAFLLVYAAFAARRALRPVGGLTVDGPDEAPALAVPGVGPGSAAPEPVAAAGPVAGPTTGSVATVAAPAPARASAPGRAPGSAPVRRRTAVLTVLALTWLNPHTYLDTIVFLGSVANQQEGDLRWWFAGGAIAGSLAWFAALGLGSRLLRPFFARPSSWRILDGLIAVVMTVLGLELLLGA
ncbi:L-lysine exporter family protein LysE/ArgO [Frigoribacterium sp. PvP120]|uniref:LysE/ArgO family amino acid transporter n=1 Tax=unclassified Frigoribacterium TaxID=2627005 RepID=UPI001B5E6E83|nr:LysE family transporter [Frigoribacterium sp. PvP121]MBP1240442.1 L-lysine exporter family protein LysE/ArgO [Frigoribacterium sp. PvP121]